MHKDTFQATSLRKPNAANETTFLALRCENFLPIFLTQDPFIVTAALYFLLIPRYKYPGKPETPLHVSYYPSSKRGGE